MPNQREYALPHLLTLRSRNSYFRTVLSLVLLIVGLAANGCEGVLRMGNAPASETGGDANEGGHATTSEAQGGNAGQSTTLRGSGGTRGSVQSTHTGGTSATTSDGGSPLGGTASSTTGGATATGGVTTTGGTDAAPETGRKGMTWGKLARYLLPQLDWLGCNGQPLVYGTRPCDATAGDTYCSAERPVLCLEATRTPRPAYTVPESPTGGMNKEYYAGWTGGRVATTPAIVGTALTSRARADAFCEETFGTTWRMAEFHDGWWIAGMSAVKYTGEDWNWNATTFGGWSFFAFAETSVTEATRYWVAIDDQKANCWDAP